MLELELNSVNKTDRKKIIICLCHLIDVFASSVALVLHKPFHKDVISLNEYKLIALPTSLLEQIKLTPGPWLASSKVQLIK